MSQTDLPGLTTLTLRDLWQERGESNNKLYRSRLETPLRPHTHAPTHIDTHITVVLDQWVLLCEGQSHTKRHTYTHKHLYTHCWEMKRALRIREQDKGQREQNVSSDLNSLIWHPAICYCSVEQMLTLRHTSLNTLTHAQMSVHRQRAASRRLRFKLILVLLL